MNLLKLISFFKAHIYLYNMIVSIPVPINEPLLNGNEEKYLIECIRSGWISSEGPFVSKFEEVMAQSVNRKYGVAVCNGSVALDLALISLDIGPGDEVILPTHTIISCPSAVIRCGAVPVLVDCNPLTFNMEAKEVEKKITKKTKAIMVVHIYGLPVDMEPIFKIASQHGLKVIEDAAEMHGQTYRGKPCGSFGDVSTFSFYPNKHITTGEGGMVLTDNKEIADKLKYYKNLCFKTEQRFIHDHLGWNYRMSNLQAAVGVAQLERLDEFVRKKRWMGNMYTSLLSGLNGIQLPLLETEYADNIFWVYPIVLKESIKLTGREFMAELAKFGVATRPFFWPIHEQPVFKKMNLFPNEIHPVAERIARMGFYVPSGMAITEAQIECVVNSLKLVINKNGV